MSTHMQHYQAAQDISAAQEHRRTLGEKVFDLGVYGGIGYVGTFLASVAVAHAGKNYPGTWMNKRYEGSKKFFDKLSKNPETVEGLADVLFLGIPGWVMLAPLKWAEDFKGSAVKSLDNMLGSGPKNSAQQAEYDNYFANQPKQSYLSLLGGRLASYPPIVGLSWFLMKGTNIGKNLTDFTHRNIKDTRLNKFNHPDKLAEMIVFDGILTAVAIGTTYAGSKAIAHYFHKDKKNIHLEQPEQSPNPFIQQKKYEGTQQPAEELQAKIA